MVLMIPLLPVPLLAVLIFITLRKSWDYNNKKFIKHRYYRKDEDKKEKNE